MKTSKIEIDHIPALIWGEKSEKAYLFVHGKMSSKEAASDFAKIAEAMGYQTISFDLPQHGQRAQENIRCDIWNGMHDLASIGEYAFANWREISLFACSLGAYFSLQAYSGKKIKNCLFQSPILDMEYLIRQMMLWFDVPEERLAEEKEVDTPIDVLSWEYYQFVKRHPIQRWDISTHILWGTKDNLQSAQVVRDFTQKFGCVLTEAEGREHAFMAEGDDKIIKQWIQKSIVPGM